jgi:hypothetical protein
VFELSNQNRRVASRQTPYFLSRRQQKVRKNAFPWRGALLSRAISTSAASLQLTAAALRGREAEALIVRRLLPLAWQSRSQDFTYQQSRITSHRL